MKTCGGVEVSSTILDLSSGWRLLVSFTLRQLYPSGNSPYQWVLARRLGEPQSQSGLYEEKKNVTPAGN
jgi:hypothetical protein